ncbi:unnamed protein product [Adineta steineri]|uniref:Uncharacterized protein n=2 Tax=Adineta steineri TaxID=433720 RepID=A0A813XUA5_9BILA|nr:unnamed protein product [Adineta steineri]CAF0913951.1 unnamed protein product [Adineta steineri]
MTSKSSNTKNFPLLNQIDEGIHSNDIDWNKNAFQTLLTSNLPTTTISYYAIDVGLRRLENSLYETYWDVTADALNDLSQFLFDKDIDDYLYEAKCQLLMYSAIAIIKMNTIRRRSIHDAKLACATMCLLLLQQSRPYEIASTVDEYSACHRSMRLRYLKRIFIIVQWIPTLSKIQLSDLQKNYERYIAIILEQLFPAVSLRDKINNFIDNHLFSNNVNDDDATSSGFVFIRRFPEFDEKIIEKYNDLMNMGLASTMNQLNNNNVRKLICCIWTLCCMIESDRVSLAVINNNTLREHFSLTPIDFEQKPINVESLNERDIIVFLLLCAQQNVHLNSGDSILHPYLLFSASHLCTQQQKNWWQTVTEQTLWNEFIDHLGTIRLDEERIHQHPPKLIILETARILFKSAQKLYEQHAKRAASSYEQYAIHYLKIAKNTQKLSDSQIKGNKQDKLFFFYSQKTLNNDQKYIEQLIEQCETYARQCDELKVLPEPQPPRTSSPTKEQQKVSEINISAVLSPVIVEKEERKPHSDVNKNNSVLDSTLFATPPSIKSRDVDVQTFIQTPSPPPPPPVITMPIIEEIPEVSEPPLPAYVDVIFSHMNEVNQWINEFCADHEAIQNDVYTIRNQLEKINRITSQMMFSNMKTFPSGSNENFGNFHPPH